MFKPALAVVAAAFAASASQAAVLYSTSFEAPAFTVAPLPGQDGWDALGSPFFTVVNDPNLAATGSQLVRLDSAELPGTTTQTRFAWRGTPQTAAQLLTNPVVVASASTAILAGGSATRTTFGGLLAFDSTGNLIVGGILISDTGAVNVINGAGQVLGTAAGAVPLNAYLDLSVAFDYSTHTIRYFVGNAELTTPVGFNVFAAADFGDADLIVQRTTPAGSTGGDVVLFDDFSVEVVPAPGAAALLGLGGLLAARRRR